LTAYKYKKFTLNIESDGTIVVNPGDSLSKYSAAMHNDFLHIYEFGRKDSSGTLQVIDDGNSISANETIFHIPTATGQPAANLPQLSNEEKKKIILSALKADFNLNGEHLKVLTKVMEKIGYVDDALTLAEIAGFITEGSLVASASSAIGLVTLFFSPIAGILTLINANETGERLYGMRAVAYTMTAWAFNEAIPSSSKRIVQNLRQGFPVVSPDKMTRYHNAWSKASRAMLNHLAATTGKGKISKNNMQILFRALGNNNRSQLCLEILKGFEKQVGGYAETLVWKSNYKIRYPQ